MAGKYWWRDEETETVEQDSSKTTSQPENKYWWRDEKTTSTGASGQNQDSGAGKYWWRADSANTVGENLTNRVNTWLENHNNYITNYQTRNSGRKFNYEDSYVSDSADWLNTISQQKSAFDTEADSILAQLDQYKGYFNNEWVESVRKTLTDARSAQDIILENSTKDNEWWSSFGNEELVNAFGSAEDAYKYYQRSDGYRQKYAGQKYDDIQKALSTLEDGEEKDWLTNNQYEFYKDDTNYNSKSRSGWKSFEAQKIAEWKEEESKTWFDKALESFATTPADTSLPNAGLINAQVAYTNDTTYREPNEKWSADQRNQFGYLWATDRDKAYEYAVQVNSQIADYEEYLAQQGAQQDATKNGWTMTGHTIGAIASAPLALGDLLGDLVEYSARGTITSDGMLSPFEYSQAVQSGIANKLNKVDENGVAQSVLPDWVPIVGGKGWGDVYSLGVSAANSLVSAYTLGGVGTLVNFIGQGGASGVDEALSRGATAEQALLYGTIVGAAEGLTEFIPAENLIKVGSSATVKNYLKQVLKQGVGEFVEEGSSSIIGNVADYFVMQDKSNFNALVKEYMDSGMSEEDAKSKAIGKLFGDAVYDAIGGFASGSVSAGLTGGYRTMVDASKHNQQNIDAVKQYGEHTDALIQEGLQSDKNSESYQLAEKYQKQVQGKDGKALSGFQIRNLVKANDAQFVVEDYNEALPKAKERLKTLGETKNVDEIADLVAKRVSRQELTRSEKSTLARSQFGAQVAKEMTTPTVETQNGTKIYNATYKSLEDRVGTEGRFGVSENGQATIRETNEAIDIGTLDVATVGDGQMTFKVAEDREVYAGDIDFADEDQSFLVSAVSDIENITPAAATAIMHDVVDTSKPLGAQLNGIDEAYTYGYNGYSVEDMKTGDFTSNLTDVQMMSAYRLGQSARSISDTDADAPIVKMRTAADAKLTAEQKTAKQKARIESKDVEVYFETGGTVTKFDEHTGKYDDKRMAAVNTAKFLSKLGIGGKYYFFESYENADGVRVYKDANGNEVEAPNGMYKDADGSIHIDLNAGNEGQGTALFTLGHELTHFVKAQSKKQFKILGDLVTQAFDKTDTSMHDRVVAKQDFLSKIRGHHVTYTEAFEEVVADAMSAMITDGSFHEKIMEIKVKDKGLFNTIKRFFEKMIAKFREVYAELTPDQRDARDIREMKDMFDKIQTAFAEALVEASDNFQAALEAEAVESLGENAKVETNAAGELLIAANERGNVQVYSERTYLEGGREKLEKALRQNGHTKEEIEKTLSYVDDALDYIKILAAGYAKNMGYTNLSNHLLADIVTNVKTGKQVMSAIVNNGDYPVNIDLSLICKKRVAYMNLMGRLIRDGVFDKVNYDGAAIAEVNEILRENGFETACLGCFVESRRLQFQTWAETIVSEWNSEVEKRNPNAGSFGFAKGKMDNLTDADIDALTRELESVKKNDQGNVNLGQGNSVTRMGRLLDALPSLQKKLTVEDLLTPEGLTALRKHDGSLFSIVKSRYGAASPKIVQDFNPYASEIAMLTFAQVKGITNNAVKGAQAYVTEVKNEYGKLKKDKGESKAAFDQRKKDHEQKIQDEAMRRYLYDIGGARIQSFSDFMIENVFDYIQIFADLAAKRLPLHGYTKEIVCMRLFGMTGAKWNGSLIAHVERSMGKEYAGLLPAGTKDGIPVTVNGKDYVIGFDDYARNVATGGKSFVQSIGMKDIIALQLDPRYSPYVGNITIGVSDVQILAMLDNPLFRMVIPYHSSGMLPMFAKLVGVDLYNDYTDYQNTTVRQYYDVNGNAVSELKNAKGEAVKADTSYAFNAEIQKTKDAKTAANNYLKWCAQRHPVYDGSKLVGYATFNPKFSNSPYGTDFTRHENYYKLLEDFNTYDSVTEASTVQGAVTMNFPSEENRLTAQQMEAYKSALRETGIFTEKDIEKYAKKANMTFKDIIAAEVGNRANYAATQAPKWEDTVKAVEAKLQKDYARDEKRSDRDYMAAVKRGDTETAQKMVDEAAKNAGFPVRLLHGTQKFGFTVTDTSLSDDKLSFFATSDVDTAKTYSSLGGKRGISEDADYDSIDEESASHEENARDMADSLADKISRWAGYYGYVDGDYIHDRFRDIVDDYERGRFSADEADSHMYDFADDVIANGYSKDAYDGQEFYEWQESEEAEALYTEVNKTISAYFALADFNLNADRSGNYDLYANTDGLLVIEGNGAKWNDIKSDVLPDITSDEYKKYGYRGHLDKWTTRSVSKYASDNGYRGVLFKNIYDDGGKSSSAVRKPADVYSFFYPQEQVKSADAVTYDDKGNVIPLSKRFKQENDDIRYSERDSTGKQLTKEQQEFFKDSMVRDADGNLLPVYHSTSEEFNTFEVSDASLYGEFYYFAVSKTWSKRFHQEERYSDPKHIKKCYLNLTNVFDLRVEPNYTAYGSGGYYGNEWIKYIEDKGVELDSRFIEMWSTPQKNKHTAFGGVPAWALIRYDGFTGLRESLIAAGYDGIVMHDIARGRLDNTVYVAFHQNQIKLASNKKPTTDPDTRYSERINTEGMSAEAKKIISNLELRTRFSRFSKGEYASYSTERIERELNRSSASEMDYAKSYIAWVKPIDFLYATTTSREGRMRIEDEAGGLDLDRLRDETQPIHLTVDFETGKIVGHEGRHRMTALNKAGVEKVAVIFDAWNDDRYNTKPVDMMRIGGQEFDRYHGGLDFYVHDMLPLSKRYADAAKKLFSEVDGSIKFSERGEGASNRHLLANAFEGLSRSSVEYKMIQDYKEQIKVLNLLDEQMSDLNAEIREIRFTKGKYDAEKLRKIEEKAERIASDIDKQDKVLIRMEASEPLRKLIERERKKEAQKTRDHVKEIQQNKKVRAEQAELRHKIQNFKKKLEAKLLRPTDRQYVPVDLIGAMVEVCNLIDTDTNLYKADGSINNAQVKRDETKEKLQNLNDEYEKLKNNSDPIYAGEFDEMVYAYLTELRDNFSGKSLKEMTTDELAEMYEILHAIDETLADARKLIGWGDAENVYEAGDSIVAEQDAIAKKRKNGKRNAVQKGWDTIDNLGLSPVRNVERMSGYNQDSALLKLFKKFEQGVRKKNKFKMDAYKLFEQLTSGKEYDDAIYNEVVGKKYTDVKGRQFGISKMQMMQSILSWERETANKSLHHIEQGGFTFADLDMLRKGNLKDAVSAENSHRVPAAVEMVAEFQEILKGDKWCQDYMAVARSFFNGMAKDAINETSISLKHRIIAKDKNYIPFEVDKNFVNTEITDMDAVQQTINSYGMLKDTKNHAPQALYITGLNNILDRHIEQVGTVYGLAIEVRNFNKVWNVRSQDESGNDPTVKESIDTNWGKEGVKHIEQAVKDIQGSRVRERNPLYDKAKSGYIGATFLLNLSVVTKQVGSLFSSTSMLRWRDPAKMIGNLIYTMANSEKIAAEVDKYTATAWMRRQGMSDAELYTLMTQAKKPGLLKAMSKLPAVFNPTKWITAMDHAVALSLWKYAKQDTAKRTGLDGEALLKATAAFYDEVVENTQSMTDVLHRPEIQKRGDVLSESFAMFKTDLYQMAGQLQATAGRFMANKSEENGKALGRTVYAIAMGAIWGSLMTTVFALLRYKVNRYRDDEDDELTIESWLKRQGFALVGDLAGYIFPIFGSEVVGVFENIMYGESDDVVDSIALTAINDLYSTMMTIGTSIKDGEMPDAAKMRQLSAKALQVFGIPANNILRALDAIKLHAEDIANGEFLSFNAGADSKTDDIYEAIMAGDQAYLSRLKSTYNDDSAYQSAVRKALRENDSRIHEAAQAKYEGRTEDYKRIFREIQKEGKFSFDDIMSAVNSEESAIRNKLEPDKATSSYTASDFVESIVLGDSKSAEAMKEDIIATKVANGKTQAEAEKEFISSVATGIRDAYSSGLLDEAGAEKMLMEYADKDEEEAASKVGYWGFCEDNPKYDYFTESNVKDYREFAEPENISLDVYAQFINGTKGLADIKDKWGDVEVTKREQVLEVIDSLPLTWAQKDALYLAAGYSESKIWDVPW